ncbi:hypothetical protein PDIG_70420 [Penicillium digitatum PHI26]|uniref:Uncharacterized protein n=2 Tax=Penicillium digitatum TaxID=36651 RepID=K9G403_PEND2|nr:hypothetical protein PDIP_79730 [Penicillium digitatum Pd1]EKV06348.1 hypothetical protein PDIP_79730 [Penicillium digitatum Pd1]EKV07966.1 hypothetical protein PDIG_70420 [Penicillium digitatum PHI26]
MDKDTPQDTNSPILGLLLEDVNKKIDKFEAQLLLKDMHQPASRLEDVAPDRGLALFVWKSEIKRQRVLLSDFGLSDGHSSVARKGIRRDTGAQENKKIHQNYPYRYSEASTNSQEHHAVHQSPGSGRLSARGLHLLWRSLQRNPQNRVLQLLLQELLNPHGHEVYAR